MKSSFFNIKALIFIGAVFFACLQPLSEAQMLPNSLCYYDVFGYYTCPLQPNPCNYDAFGNYICPSQAGPCYYDFAGNYICPQANPCYYDALGNYICPPSQANQVCSWGYGSVCLTFSGRSCPTYAVNHTMQWSPSCIVIGPFYACMNVQTFPKQTIQRACYPRGVQCSCNVQVINGYYSYEQGIIW